MHSDFQPAKWDKQQREHGASFLQTALWGEFQRSIGHKPHFVSGEGWSCLLLERKAPIGRYLFAPYGPTIGSAQAPTVFKSLKNYGLSKKADWLRLEPVFNDGGSDKWRADLIKAGGRPTREVEPSLTRIVDLRPSADELLASLSQTTRNIIRRNQRQPVLNFRTSRDPADINILTNMLDLVASRKGIGFFTADYYKRQAEVLMPAGMSAMEIAYLGSEPVGAALIHDFAGQSTYTNAGSLPRARDQNVSALLLYQAMINAKQRGNQKIDLYGIAPDNAPPSHPWSGFSSFKKKFGGDVVEHAGTWDFPLTKKYSLYRSALAAKKLLRR